MAAAARPSQVPTGAMGAALQQSLLDAQVQNEIAPAAVASTEDEAVAARKRARQEADPAAHRRNAIIEGILKQPRSHWSSKSSWVTLPPSTRPIS